MSSESDSPVACDSSSDYDSSTDPDSTWLQSASDRSPEAFIQKFGIFVKQHGHKRYILAIEKSGLETDVKSTLLKEFSVWKANKGVKFWLDRQSQSSQISTAFTLVKGSESYARDSIRRTEKRSTGGYQQSD